MRFCLLFLFTVASASFAASGGKGTGGKSAGWAPSPPSTATISTSGGSANSRMQMLDPRNVPPLAPSRKVTPQDCSKPIALDGGNLQCR
jgi:hypothetical protein